MALYSLMAGADAVVFSEIIAVFGFVVLAAS